MRKRKGFTLMELILALIIFSIVMVMFATMTSFNYKFVRMTFDNDDAIHDFVANNTFIYNKLRDSEMVIFENGYLFLDEGVFTIKNKKLYYNTEPIYDLLPGSEINYEGNVIEFNLILDNMFEQEVNIIVNK